MGRHRTRLIGWHPSSPDAVVWLDAEIERRGGGRGAQSAILDEALEKTMTAARLTDADRDLIAGARETGPRLRASSDIRDQRAGWLLKELAALAERLGGPVPDEEANHG